MGTDRIRPTWVLLDFEAGKAYRVRREDKELKLTQAVEINRKYLFDNDALSLYRALGVVPE